MNFNALFIPSGIINRLKVLFVGSSRYHSAPLPSFCFFLLKRRYHGLAGVSCSAGLFSFVLNCAVFMSFPGEECLGLIVFLTAKMLVCTCCVRKDIFVFIRSNIF